MENVINFLSAPQLADVISYFFIVLGYIYILFIKCFVKKDNVFTRTTVTHQVDDVNKIKGMLERQRELLDEERELLKKERETWAKERAHLAEIQASQAEAIAIIAGNVPELVKRGIANKISVSLYGENQKKLIVEEEKRYDGGSTND